MFQCATPEGGTAKELIDPKTIALDFVRNESLFLFSFLNGSCLHNLSINWFFLFCYD